MKWSNITLLREISEVCVRKTVFQTTKATQVYCSWQVMVCYRYSRVERPTRHSRPICHFGAWGIPHFNNCFSKKIYSECCRYSVLHKIYTHVL